MHAGGSRRRLIIRWSWFGKAVEMRGLMYAVAYGGSLDSPFSRSRRADADYSLSR